MIIHLNKSVSPQQAEALAVKHQSILLNNGKLTLITSGKLKAVDEEQKAVAEEIFETDSDIQLASKQYIKTKHEVYLGGETIGG